MTKEDIISKVKALNLPKNSYIVFGSCPMAAAGIREANDINLLVSTEVYKSLENNGWQKIYKGPNDSPVIHGVFEAHDNWDFSAYNLNLTLEDLLTNATEVNDIPFASIENVRKWKVASGRDKDIADIKLIDLYLEKQKL